MEPVTVLCNFAKHANGEFSMLFITNVINAIYAFMWSVPNFFHKLATFYTPNTHSSSLDVKKHPITPTTSVFFAGISLTDEFTTVMFVTLPYVAAVWKTHRRLVL
jgi:uncharacterized membrane protein